MTKRLNFSWHGLLAFAIVLLLMPLGHALMVVTELILPESKLFLAGCIGIAGVILLALGVRIQQKPLSSTLLGLLSAILVWTGWIEFSFVWIADKLHVEPIKVDGAVVTKPEYLVMMSSLGLLAAVMVLVLFTKSRCLLFRWFQRNLGMRDLLKGKIRRPLAVTTFFETIMIIWLFYLVLLLVYDDSIAGDSHPAAYIVAFGSLIWSLFLFIRLVRIRQLDFAIRYAIPAVIIFWNFVEILGRWDVFSEFWIEPSKHWIINSCILLIFLTFVLASLGLIRWPIFKNKRIALTTNHKGNLL